MTAIPLVHIDQFLSCEKTGPANELILVILEDLGDKLEHIEKSPRRVLRRSERRCSSSLAIDSACLHG